MNTLVERSREVSKLGEAENAPHTVGFSGVRVWLSLEGLVALVATGYFYGALNGNWWLFGLFLLAPDFSMLGYLKDNRVGAFFYNLAHTYAVSLAFVLVGRLVGSDFVTLVGLVLCAHISMDRLMGYGLKYVTAFKHTHLQRV